MNKGIVAFLAVAGMATAASAQTGGWVIDVSGGPVSPSNPSATVQILAEFTGAFAFAAGDGDLQAGDGGWSAIAMLPVGDPLGPPPPGTTAGTIADPNVNGYLLGQIMFLPAGILPSTANPIPLWEGTWSTGDFTPRNVDLNTANTSQFLLYDTAGRSVPISAPTMGAGVITVVPEPATLALLGLAGLVAVRRRR